MQRYEIRLSVHDRHTNECWHMAVAEDEFPIFDERTVDDVARPFAPGLIPFDMVVKIMKERIFRREYLLHAAHKLAERLADYIEDKEGWHGEDRRDRIKRTETAQKRPTSTKTNVNEQGTEGDSGMNRQG